MPLGETNEPGIKNQNQEMLLSKKIDLNNKNLEIKNSSIICIKLITGIKLLLQIILTYLKKAPSVLFSFVILINVLWKIRRYGVQVFSSSEYSIMFQSFLVCTYGIFRSSFILNGVTISNILITYISNYADITSVSYTGKNILKYIFCCLKIPNIERIFRSGNEKQRLGVFNQSYHSKHHH